MHFDIYYIFYSQPVSVGILAIFRVLLLLQEYKTYTFG